MQRSRVSLAFLMAVVALSALGFAALRSASIWWASGLFTLDVLVVCIATVFGLVGHGRARAFGAGAAVFGGVYVVLVFGLVIYPPAQIAPGAISGHGLTAPPLIVQAAIDWASPRQVQGASAVYVEVVPVPETFDDSPLSMPAAPMGTRRIFNRMDFRRTVHALLALIAALVGGGVGLWAASVGRPDLSGPRPPAGAPAGPG